MTVNVFSIHTGARHFAQQSFPPAELDIFSVTTGQFVPTWPIIVSQPEWGSHAIRSARRSCSHGSGVECTRYRVPPACRARMPYRSHWREWEIRI